MEETRITRITITIDRDVLARLDGYARRSRWSRSTAAAALIEEALAARQDAGQEVPGGTH
jgi:metal-responsive CopG/Arc/MetJ family transcriptional regulator